MCIHTNHIKIDESLAIEAYPVDGYCNLKPVRSDDISLVICQVIEKFLKYQEQSKMAEDV